MSPNNKVNHFDSYQNTYGSSNNFSFEDDIDNSTSSLLWLRRLLNYRTCHIVRFMVFVYAAISVGWFLCGTYQRLSANRARATSRNGPTVVIVPNLIWSDEFDGDTFDLTKWSFVNGNGCDIGLCGWGKDLMDAIIVYHQHTLIH